FSAFADLLCGPERLAQSCAELFRGSLCQVVITLTEIFRPAAEGKTEAREHGNYLTAFAFIPAVAAAGLPYRFGHFYVNVLRVALFRRRIHFNHLDRKSVV